MLGRRGRIDDFAKPAHELSGVEWFAVRRRTARARSIADVHRPERLAEVEAVPLG
jgi:hypothetical protein